MSGASSRLILGRIDTAREQRFECGVDAGAAKRALDQCVEAESRQVAFVEDDRMAEVDGPAVVRRVCNEIEQRLRPRAVTRVPITERFH
jgi:hypothetical protein